MEAKELIEKMAEWLWSYKSTDRVVWGALEEYQKNYWRQDAKVLIAHFPEWGLVQLAEDQTVPEIKFDPHGYSTGCPSCGEEVGTASDYSMGASFGQQTMLDAGWRRVQLGGKE